MPSPSIVVVALAPCPCGRGIHDQVQMSLALLGDRTLPPRPISTATILHELAAISSSHFSSYSLIQRLRRPHPKSYALTLFHFSLLQPPNPSSIIHHPSIHRPTRPLLQFDSSSFNITIPGSSFWSFWSFWSFGLCHR